MSERPRLLDLFCGAGGAAVGYHRAGFDVVGVAIVPQPHFPFEFVQCDWQEALATIPGAWERAGEEYAIHASPPCQRYSTMTKKWGRSGDHPDLVEPVREALVVVEVPYVIENVVGAPLNSPIMLCGSMFGLGANGGQIRRHRLFETSFQMPVFLPPCRHIGRAIAVYGHAGGSSKRDGLKFGGTNEWREAMGIDWMTGAELAQAIPPAYTEFIGHTLSKALKKGETT